MNIPPPPWDPSIEEYHAQPLFHSVSSTSLRLFRDDRQKFQELLRKDLENPRWRLTEKKGKAHQDIGGAVGGYFLDQREYRTRLAQLGKSDREKVHRMTQALQEAPMDTWAGRIFRYLRTPAGRPEWTFLWPHEAGVNVRIRCDKVIGWPDEDKVTNLEFKTSRRTDPEGFKRDIRDFDYYNQLALQDAGLRVAFPGAEVENFWAFISSTAPHRACILRPDPVKLEAAAEENTQRLAELSALMTEMLEDPHRNWGARREPWEFAGVPEYA